MERSRSLSLQPQQILYNLKASSATESGQNHTKFLHTRTTLCFCPTTHSSYNPFICPTSYQHNQFLTWPLPTDHKLTNIGDQIETVLPLPTRTNRQNTQQTNSKSTRSSRRTQQTKTKKVISRRYSQWRKQ
jgi:hypothetical protein